MRSVGPRNDSMKTATKRLSYAGAVAFIIASLIPFMFAGICMHRLHRDGQITYTNEHGGNSRTVRGREAAVPIVAATLIGFVFLGVGLNQLRSRIRHNAFECAAKRRGGVVGFRRGALVSAYAIKTKASQCVVWFIVGSGVIMLGLDCHVWRVLPWDIKADHWVWMIACGFGALLVAGAVKEAIAPATLLFADSRGITLYVACTSRTWNTLTKRFDVTGRRGTPRLIPWGKITSIDRGIIDMTTGHRAAQEEPALRVLCAPSVCLDDCSISSLLNAWTGFPEDDNNPHNREDRRTLPPERLLSGFVLREMSLKDSLDVTIGILEEMRQHRT